MSAFVVVLERRGAGVPQALMNRLASRLVTHGPDGTGLHVGPGIGIAHALLRTDLDSPAAAGPHDAGAGVMFAADLRFDARDDLIARLDARAALARGAPLDDPALLAAAWRTWKGSCVDELHGDFSFALWDAAVRTLFCARDPFGVHPLYFSDLDDCFICSNVLAAVRAHPSVSGELRTGAIADFLRHGFNADVSTTSLADVQRLPPGHTLDASAAARGVTVRPWWRFPVPEPIRYRRPEEYTEHFRAVLGGAVRDRTRTPRATILLSGGLDSTTIAATARRVAPELPLVAYTTSYAAILPDDEPRLAQAVAGRLGIRHVVLDAGVGVPFAQVDSHAFDTPEPTDDYHLDHWTSLFACLSSDGSVTLDGEDGDALLAPPGLLTMFRSLPPSEVVSAVMRYAVSHRRLPHTGLWLRRRLREWLRPQRRGMPAWVRPSAARFASDPSAHCRRFPAHPLRPEVQDFLTAPVWQSYLESVNPAWTRAAVDVRFPLLDERVLNFTLAIPPIPWCQRKELLRVTMRGTLPDEVLARPKTPVRGYDERQVRQWREARGPAHVRFGSRIAEYVDVRAVSSVLHGGDTGDVVAAWRALMLERWLCTFESGTSAGTLTPGD